MKKIVICGGHLTPALALIEELRINDDKKETIKIIFFGRKYATEGSNSLSAEFQAITKDNIEFIEITTGRLQRKFTRYTIPSLLKIPIGFALSFYYLLQTRPNLIVSFGSYISLPVVFGGWLLGIDSISHETAPAPGLATKINSLFAKKIFLSWPNSQKYFNPSKSETIGNLIRKSIFTKSARSKDINNFLSKSKDLIYVTGGNQGSHFINELIFAAQKKINNFSILHQLGTTNFKKDYEKAKRIKSSNYKAVSYIDSEDIGAVLNKASIIVSRAGANIVYELSVLAKPAILIPLTVSSGGEQLENAKIMEEAGSAIILKQEGLTPEIFIKSVQSMLRNHTNYKKSAHQFSKFFPPDAAKILARFVLQTINH